MSAGRWPGSWTRPARRSLPPTPSARPYKEEGPPFSRVSLARTRPPPRPPNGLHRGWDGTRPSTAQEAAERATEAERLLGPAAACLEAEQDAGHLTRQTPPRRMRATALRSAGHSGVGGGQAPLVGQSMAASTRPAARCQSRRPRPGVGGTRAAASAPSPSAPAPPTGSLTRWDVA